MRGLAAASVMLTVVVGACTREEVQPSAEAQVIVPLERVVHTSCEDRTGWTNLLFEGNPAETDGAVALFAELPNGPRVEVVKRETEAGTEYWLRSSRSGERPLEFVAVDGLLCATVEIQVRGDDRPTRVQIGLADDYAYGRIAEHREGALKTEVGNRKVELHAASRAALRFDQLSGLELFVDTEGRNAIRYQTVLDPLRGILYSDRVDGNAFVVAGERFGVDSVTADGTGMLVQRMSDSIAAARGFRAPLFGGPDIGGGRYVLSPQGRITVIEFWSIDCGYSERARSEDNRLASEVRARGGAYVSMSRESDASAVRAFLDTHPREGNLLVHDDSTWTLWNPETATPLYYVIGPDGTILLRELGASAVRLAAAAVTAAGRNERRWRELGGATSR